MDDRSHSLLKSVAWAEDITVSELLRQIIKKKIRELAHKKGMLRKDEIEEYILKERRQNNEKNSKSHSTRGCGGV